MKRIAIIGSAGSGKSTLARRLGEKLNIPVYHMDTLFWEPGWNDVSVDELANRQQKILQLDQWIIDGNYSRVWKQRMQDADTIIFLDIHRTTCLFRVMKRFYIYRNKTRPDMTIGCPEKIDWEFLKYIWRYPHERRPKTLQVIQHVKDTKFIKVLRNKRDVEHFLSE